MRALLLCPFMLLISIIAYPQEEQKEFQKFRNDIQIDFDKDLEKSQNEYNVFIDSINKDYLSLILKAEKEFSELLTESFREFKLNTAIEKTEDTKPKQIPKYKIIQQQSSSDHLRERKISLGEPQESLLLPGSVDGQFAGLNRNISFQFLGSFLSVYSDERMSQMPDVQITDSITIKNSYDFLLNTDYPIVLNQFAEISSQLNLNDWDYYCLINEFSKSLTDNPNKQKLIAWFLLLESNYKVKIGYFNNDVSILFATAQILYNTPWFIINGERYYVIKYKHHTIITYDIDYFKGYKYMNMFHDKPIQLEEVIKNKTISFPFRGKSYSISVSYNQNYVDYYATYPLIPVDYYFALPVSSTFKESVEINIAPYLQNKNQQESLHFLLSLVQYGFSYKTDLDQFSKEKYMVPEEVLYYPNSDCDDKTILFSYLVSELLHLDIIALDFNGHICSAVGVSDSSVKGNIIHDGKEYIVCDATYVGAPPGIMLPTFKINDAEILDFNKNLNQFILAKKIWSSVIDKGLLRAENSNNITVSQDRCTFLTGMIINDKLTYSENAKINVGNSTSFVARLDSVKEIQWVKQFRGSGTNFGYCISEVNDQFLYVFGYFEDTLILDNFKIEAQEQGSYYLAKLNKTGKPYWLKKIYLPIDSLSQGLTMVFDSNGNLKYYLANDHYPHGDNYLMKVDGKENCYIYAVIPKKNSSEEISKFYLSGADFDIISYLVNGNNNLLKQNVPGSVSMLYTLFKYLNNNGSVIQGTSILETITDVNKNLKSDLSGQYSEIGKISEIINSEGITYIRTTNHQPINISPLQAQHGSRMKLSYINGNAKIDVLYGIRIGSNQIWNDVNSILLDKTTGQIIYNYDNRYRKKMPVHSQLL
jgi:hypothetical protein